ncbi:MAG: hypothetical protein JWN30_2495 [Bacilli bacterium]|nr:hypothetical protein [Bacilli bacterium]
MNSISIRQPVAVKLVLTEDTKREIVKNIQQAIGQVQIELEQLDFQSRRALDEAAKQGQGAVEAITARLEEEHNTRTQKREEMMQQLSQIQQTAIGEELPQGQVETTIEVNVGDSWLQVLQGQEIIIKDGVVSEIRRPGGQD